MAPRRTQPPRPPAAPPANAEDGAARVRAQLVKLFTRQDGKAADWRLMVDCLYRVGFDLADEELDDAARKSLMRRVHEGAEHRMTGGFADGSAAEKTAPAAPVSAPSITGAFKASRPTPPR